MLEQSGVNGTILSLQQPSPVTDITAFSHLKDPLLLQFLTYYLNLRQGDRVPRRGQVSPMDFPRLLSNVFLYECDTTAQDFHLRLAGSQVAELLQTVKAGTKMSDVFPPDVFPIVLQRYRRICTELVVMHNIGKVFHLMGGTGMGERIAMPLLDNAGVPSFIIGATVYTLPKHEIHVPPGREAQIVTYTPL